MSEHTPLPWQYEVQAFGSAIAKDGVCIATTHGTRAIVKGDLPHAENAALIVRSVNLHADLVAALRKASQLASVAGDWNLDEVEIDGEMIRTFELQEQIDSLIAKATS